MAALDSLTWTQAELTEIKKQFNNLAAVPNYPGAYIVGRYTGFAFLAAYNDKADPANELLSYINEINKEISRKRYEFDLEILDFDKAETTLANKRINQAIELLNAFENRDQYKDVIDTIEDVLSKLPKEVKSGVTDEYLDSLVAANDALKAANATAFAEITSKLDDAIAALISYNIYY
jgi:hypothetical protein